MMVRRALAVVTVLAALLVATPQPAQAAATPAPYFGACSAQGVVEFLGLKSWDSCLQHDANGVPQLTKLSDIWLIALPLLEDAIKLAAYVAAGFVTWGGIKYLKSQGDPSELNEARQIIFNALFGLMWAMISVAVVNFIAGIF